MPPGSIFTVKGESGARYKQFMEWIRMSRAQEPNTESLPKALYLWIKSMNIKNVFHGF
jgi:hypothetical protein